MGLTIWYFLRSRPGRLRSITRKSIDAFFHKEGTLPVDDDGLVRSAQVIVQLLERRAVEVIQVDFFQSRALEDGTIDGKHLWEVMATGGMAAFGGIANPDNTPGVVQAEHRFAQRRLDHLQRWEPEESDLHVLRELVNTKAKAEIM